jgi:hypothetical protein
VTLTKAIREQKRVRVLLAGYGGSGKSYTALAVGEALAKTRGTRLAVLDAEAGASSLYADRFDFDSSTDWDFNSIEGYIAAIRAASRTHGVIVVDGLTPAWDTILALSDKAKGTNAGVAIWATLTPAWNRLMREIVMSPADMIVTALAKEETVMEPNERGKIGIRRLGTTLRLGKDAGQHFDLVGMMSDCGIVEVTKSRFPTHLPVGTVMERPGADLAALLSEEANTGVVPAPPPVETPPAPKGNRKPAPVEPAPTDWAAIIARAREKRPPIPDLAVAEAKARKAGAIAEADELRAIIREREAEEAAATEPAPRLAPETPASVQAEVEAEGITPGGTTAAEESWFEGLTSQQIADACAGSNLIGRWREANGGRYPGRLGELPLKARADFRAGAVQAGFGPKDGGK